MNVQFSSVLSALRGVLREEVVPELTSDHALAQTVAVIDILDKLSGLADWSSDLLRGKIAELETGTVEFRTRAADLGLTTVPGPADATPTTQEELAQRLTALNRDVVALTDWLFDLPDPLPADDLRALQMILRNAIQAAQAEERRLITLSDFSATA